MPTDAFFERAIYTSGGSSGGANDSGGTVYRTTRLPVIGSETLGPSQGLYLHPTSDFGVRHLCSHIISSIIVLLAYFICDVLFLATANSYSRGSSKTFFRFFFGLTNLSQISL